MQFRGSKTNPPCLGMSWGGWVSQNLSKMGFARPFIFYPTPLFRDELGGLGFPKPVQNGVWKALHFSGAASTQHPTPPTHPRVRGVSGACQGRVRGVSGACQGRVRGVSGACQGRVRGQWGGGREVGGEGRGGGGGWSGLGFRVWGLGFFGLGLGGFRVWGKLKSPFRV